MLRISNGSPFTTEPLVDVICQYSDNDIVNYIIDGTITHATIYLIHVNLDKEPDKLFKFLQSATTSNDTPIHDIDDTATLEKYRQLFKKER